MLTFFLHASVTAIANDSCSVNINIATDSGNREYTKAWRCQCPPAVTFEFDDASTPDTITSGGSIDVYVKGGCPPFVWGDAGTGYSWAYGEDVPGVPGSKQTKTRSNQLVCSGGT